MERTDPWVAKSTALGHVVPWLGMKWRDLPVIILMIAGGLFFILRRKRKLFSYVLVTKQLIQGTPYDYDFTCWKQEGGTDT